MIDSRVKGRTAELKCRDKLRELTNLMWERIPMSGALDPKHGLKGDLYVPKVDTKYCVEVKHYADDHIDTKLLTSINPMLLQWWAQTVRESNQIDKDPLLIFKHNRSKWFVVTDNFDLQLTLQDEKARHLTLYPEGLCICLLTDFCNYEEFE